MTKDDIMKTLGMDHHSYDVALPQPWVDEVYDVVRGFASYDEIVGGFVWLYDERAKVFGRPFPLGDKATQIIDRVIKHKKGDLS